MKTHASALLVISLTTAALGIGLPMNVAAQSNAPAPAVTAPPVAAAPALPYGVQEVLKMHQGGISKDIIIHYIDSSTLPLHLSADQIIYLQKINLPQDIVSDMLRRDGELQREASAMYQQQMVAAAAAGNGAGAPPPPTDASAPPPVAQPSGPAPQVAPYAYPPAPSTTVVSPTVVYPDYYPYYGYPYYGPNVIVGGGWGWGWGGRGWGGRGGWGGHGGWHR